MSDTFKDAKGRIWDTSINLAIARRIDKSDFKAYYPGPWSFIKPERAVFSAMVSDTSFMFAVIWAIVIDQAKQMFIDGKFVWDDWGDPSGPFTDQDDVRRSVESQREKRRASVQEVFSTDKDGFNLAELEFVSAIQGEAVEEGRTAFWRSLADFFRDQKTALSVLERQYNLLRQKVEEKLPSLEPEIAIAMDKALEKDLKNVRDRLVNMGS